jgi:hypothetical protein
LAAALLRLGKVLLQRGDPLAAGGTVPSAGIAGLDSFGKLLLQHRLFPSELLELRVQAVEFASLLLQLLLRGCGCLLCRVHVAPERSQPAFTILQVTPGLLAPMTRLL